jgi:hypothetical protein
LGGFSNEKENYVKKSLLAVFCSALLLLVAAGTSKAANQTFTGEIMDSACASMGSHEGMMKGNAAMKDAKDCTLACVKGGAQFVLYDSANKMVYKLDDQTKPTKFAGGKVKVSGTLDKATNTIHVASITAG